MTKDEFIFYVKGIIASEMEKGRVDALRSNMSNADIHLIGPLKLIKDALDNIQTDFVPTPGFQIDPITDMIPYSEICACNPKNGGSGMCGCTIGNTMIPKYPSGPFKWGSTTSTNIINETITK